MKFKDFFKYDENLPGILEEIPDKYPVHEGTFETASIYGEVRAPGVSPTVYNAVRKYARMVEEGWKGCGTGVTENGAVCAEILRSGTSKRPENVDVVVIAKSRGTVYGGTMDVSADTIMPYSIRDGKDGEVIVLALMDMILKDNEAKEEYDAMLPGLLVDPETMKKEEFERIAGMTVREYGAHLAKLSDNIYQRIAKDQPAAANIKVSISPTGDLMKLKHMTVKNGTYAPEKESVKGAFYVLAKDVAAKTGSGTSKKVSELRALYNLGAVLTAEEQAAVPVMPDEMYSVSERVEKICRLVFGSTDLPCRIRTWMEVGPAGTGKTTDVKLVAAILNLGYAKMTCNAGTELFDMIGQVFPNEGGENLTAKEILAKADLPTTDDIAFDLENSYRRMTGKEMPKGYTVEEAIALLLKRTLEEQRKLVADGKDFSYREGPLAKAIQGNYVFEIQEAMSVQQQGVMVGLNSIMEQDGSLELPSGKVLRKNKYMCIAMTSNGVDYAGNMELQGSVESRNALYFEVPNPPVEVMAANAMKQSGLADKTLAKEMASFVAKVSEWRAQHGINCGSCGPRELMFWMACVAVDGIESVYEHAKTCIVNKATHDPGERVEIITQILDGTSLAI